MYLASKTETCGPGRTRRTVNQRDGGQKRLLTILIHGRLEALGKAARATLVPMSLVHRTSPLQITGGFAGVNAISMDAALKKPRAA